MKASKSLSTDTVVIIFLAIEMLPLPSVLSDIQMGGCG
jgi:hypothetical protein